MFCSNKNELLWTSRPLYLYRFRLYDITTYRRRCSPIVSFGFHQLRRHKNTFSNVVKFRGNDDATGRRQPIIPSRGHSVFTFGIRGRHFVTARVLLTVFSHRVTIIKLSRSLFPNKIKLQIRGYILSLCLLVLCRPTHNHHTHKKTCTASTSINVTIRYCLCPRVRTLRRTHYTTQTFLFMIDTTLPTRMH